MISSDDLIAVIEKNPSSFDIYSVVADLLEEEDNYPLSFVFRWCERCKKHPSQSSDGWYWYSDLGFSEESTKTHTISTKWVIVLDDDELDYPLSHLPRWRKTFRKSLEMLIPFMEK